MTMMTGGGDDYVVCREREREGEREWRAGKAAGAAYLAVLEVEGSVLRLGLQSSGDGCL